MKNNASIVYFLSRSLFLGFGISLLFYQSSKDCYFGALLGTLLGLIITYFYNYIINHKEKRDLKALYSKNKFIGFIARLLMFSLSILLLLYTLILYTVFVISFLLVNSPFYYVVIPYLLLGVYLAFKDLKLIARIASILMPISIIIGLFSTLGLLSFFEFSNFLPILTNTPQSFFLTALTFAGISTFPNILTLHFDPDVKGNMKMYLLASLLIIFACICTNGVLGSKLTQIFRFPEYMVLKQLQVFKFIEKVENIFSIVWIIDLFVTTTMSIYSIKETLTANHPKTLTAIIILIMTFIVDKFFVFNYVNELKLYYILPYLSLFCTIIIIFPFMYLVKKK